MGARPSREGTSPLAGIHTIHADDLGNPMPRAATSGCTACSSWARTKRPCTGTCTTTAPATGAPGSRRTGEGSRCLSRSPSGARASSPTPPRLRCRGDQRAPPGRVPQSWGKFRWFRARRSRSTSPANSEIVIEGYVSHEAGLIVGIRAPPRSRWARGPSSKAPSGTTRASTPSRIGTRFLTVTAITHRRHPIYPTTIVGLPPQEDYFMGKGDGAAVPSAAAGRSSRTSSTTTCRCSACSTRARS